MPTLEELRNTMTVETRTRSAETSSAREEPSSDERITLARVSAALSALVEEGGRERVSDDVLRAFEGMTTDDTQPAAPHALAIANARR